MDEITNLMLQQIKEVEQKDENQILAELAGETIGEYTYTIEVYNRRKKRMERKVRLSWVGVREVSRSRGNIVLAEPDITETEDALRIVFKATDLTRNFTVFGGCHQPKQQTVKDIDKKTGEEIGSHQEPDPYYFAKGLSKAQRNALNLCIPGEYISKCIDRFQKLAGKTALSKEEKPKALPKSKAGTKAATKPVEDWNSITEEMVPDYPHLEPIIWRLCKLQPTQMYQEFGFGGRAEMTMSAWEAFIYLKGVYGEIPHRGNNE